MSAGPSVLGLYHPGTSVVHRAPLRTRMVVLALFGIGVVLARGPIPALAALRPAGRADGRGVPELTAPRRAGCVEAPPLSRAPADTKSVLALKWVSRLRRPANLGRRPPRRAARLLALGGGAAAQPA